MLLETLNYVCLNFSEINEKEINVFIILLVRTFFEMSKVISTYQYKLMIIFVFVLCPKDKILVFITIQWLRVQCYSF